MKTTRDKHITYCQIIQLKFEDSNTNVAWMEIMTLTEMNEFAKTPLVQLFNPYGDQGNKTARFGD